MECKDVAIVLVGFNSSRHLGNCLDSLAELSWGTYSSEVVYVDNASVDGSVELVSEQYPTVRVIVNDRNFGFSRACNQGAAAVHSRYIYLLNVDTVLFSDTLLQLLEFMDRSPGVAAAGNRLLNPDLSDQWSARRFPTWVSALVGRRGRLGRLLSESALVKEYLYKDQLVRGEPFPVDWIPGSCTLVRRGAFDVVGGVPEDMHYWGDAVFCDRLWKSGGEVYIVPRARLIHDEGGATTRKSASIRRWLIGDFHEGAYRFYCEHYQLGKWHPARWMARLGLGARAQLLVLADFLHLSERTDDTTSSRADA